MKVTYPIKAGAIHDVARPVRAYNPNASVILFLSACKTSIVLEADCNEPPAAPIATPQIKNNLSGKVLNSLRLIPKNTSRDVPTIRIHTTINVHIQNIITRLEPKYLSAKPPRKVKIAAAIPLTIPKIPICVIDQPSTPLA